MREPRSFERLNRFERLDEQRQVVAVDRSEIPEAKLLEEHPLREERLHALFPPSHQRRHRSGGTIGDSSDDIAQPVVQGIALDRIEILRHRADVGRDRHLIVVQHDNHVAIGMTGVIESLVGEAGR